MTGFFLLDTSLLSPFAPGRGAVPDHVEAWLADRQSETYLSVITVLELERGIAKLVRQGQSAKARAISAWIGRLAAEYESKTIDINRDIAQCAGRLEDRAIGNGFSPGLADALIAATAILHDGVVLTRNLRHFQQLGADCLDPFSFTT